MRHGETYFNLYNRMQGWSDTPLTARGIQDVSRSGAGLADVSFDAVYSSDLRRTMETANLILQENNHAQDLTVQPMPEFREIFFGSFEGLDSIEVWSKLKAYLGYEGKPNYHDDKTVIRELDGFHAIDPYHDAEKYMAFWLRVERGLAKIIDQYRDTGKTILVVSHGMTIRNMLQAIIPSFSIDRSVDNASVSIVHYEDGLYHLDTFNSTAHFVKQPEDKPASYKILPSDD